MLPKVPGLGNLGILENFLFIIISIIFLPARKIISSRFLQGRLNFINLGTCKIKTEYSFLNSFFQSFFVLLSFGPFFWKYFFNKLVIFFKLYLIIYILQKRPEKKEANKSQFTLKNAPISIYLCL